MSENQQLGEITEALHNKFINNSKTIAVAESCTGGGLGYQLTSLPGSSAYFVGGVVSYSNAIKTGHLGVLGSDIKAWGAVSEQVATAMATGCLERFGSDWSIAITGVAGPGGGSSGKPVGTVWIAHASKGGGLVECRKHSFGDQTREGVRLAAIKAALSTLDRLT